MRSLLRRVVGGQMRSRFLSPEEDCWERRAYRVAT